MTLTHRRTLSIATVAVLAVTAAAGLRAFDSDATAVGQRELIPVDQRQEAPGERRPLLVGDGERGLPDLRGSPVVMNFWASWCGPCRAEQPDLNRVHEDYHQLGVQFIGVDIQDTLPNGRSHVEEFEIPYDSLFDPDSSYAAAFGDIGARAIPTTLVVDRRGRVAARLFGTTDYAELTSLLDRLLLEDD